MRRPGAGRLRARRMHRALGLGVLAGLTLCSPLQPGAYARDPGLTVVSTTSTGNSGLLDWLLPAFTADTGIRVRLISVGTGQALRIGRNGDADALVVHHPPAELAFVVAGHGVERRPVMHNDFVIVGPASDPAGVRGLADAATALARIAAAQAVFLSRGDESGTHAKERELWRDAAIDPTRGGRAWYRETGSGQGTNLNVASAMGGYALTDRATWLNFGNKGPLELLVDGDARLCNPYSAIVVNPRRHPHVRAAEARAFVDWLSRGRGQGLIAEYRIADRAAFLTTAAGCPKGSAGADSGAVGPPATGVDQR